MSKSDNLMHVVQLRGMYIVHCTSTQYILHSEFVGRTLSGRIREDARNAPARPVELIKYLPRNG